MAGAGILLGGLFSLGTHITNIFVRREERKDNENKREHEQKRWLFDEKMFKLQSQQSVSETAQAIARMDTSGSWKGLVASLNQQTALADNNYKWANSVVTLIRPILTIFLLAVTVWASWKSVGFVLATDDFQMVGGISGLAALNSFIENNQSLAVIYTLTETTVTWWFGDRSFKRSLQNSQSANTIRAAGDKEWGGKLEE